MRHLWLDCASTLASTCLNARWANLIQANPQPTFVPRCMHMRAECAAYYTTFLPTSAYPRLVLHVLIALQLLYNPPTKLCHPPACNFEHGLVYPDHWSILTYPPIACDSVTRTTPIHCPIRDMVILNTPHFNPKTAVHPENLPVKPSTENVRCVQPLSILTTSSELYCDYSCIRLSPTTVGDPRARLMSLSLAAALNEFVTYDIPCEAEETVVTECASVLKPWPLLQLHHFTVTPWRACLVNQDVMTDLETLLNETSFNRLVSELPSFRQLSGTDPEDLTNSEQPQDSGHLLPSHFFQTAIHIYVITKHPDMHTSSPSSPPIPLTCPHCTATEAHHLAEGIRSPICTNCLARFQSEGRREHRRIQAVTWFPCLLEEHRGGNGVEMEAEQSGLCTYMGRLVDLVLWRPESTKNREAEEQ